MSVTSLQDYRTKAEPHISGLAICLGCRYEWIAVAPTATTVLDCPSCSCEKGVFQGLPLPADRVVWTCRNCACDYFRITPQEIMCAHCGEAQRWESQ